MLLHLPNVILFLNCLLFLILRSLERSLSITRCNFGKLHFNCRGLLNPCSLHRMFYYFLFPGEVVLELSDFCFCLFFGGVCLFLCLIFVVRTKKAMYKEEPVQRLSLVFFIFDWQLYACFLDLTSFANFETDITFSYFNIHKTLIYSVLVGLVGRKVL